MLTMFLFKRTLPVVAMIMAANAALGDYAIDWYSMDGGGGSSSGDVFEVRGTAGQTDASTVLTGGDYTLTGGFWVGAPEVTVLVGDLNCDGAVDFGDINPFALLLSSPNAWSFSYPGCPAANGDINDDGSVNFGDINAFVNLLSGG